MRPYPDLLYVLMEEQLLQLEISNLLSKGNAHNCKHTGSGVTHISQLLTVRHLRARLLLLRSSLQEAPGQPAGIPHSFRGRPCCCRLSFSASDSYPERAALPCHQTDRLFHLHSSRTPVPYSLLFKKTPFTKNRPPCTLYTGRRLQTLFFPDHCCCAYPSCIFSIRL